MPNIETVLFDSEKWTAAKAKTWLKKHDYKTSKIVLERNYYHARQKKPTHTKKNYYTVKLYKKVNDNKNNNTKKKDTGIRLVLSE